MKTQNSTADRCKRTAVLVSSLALLALLANGCGDSAGENCHAAAEDGDLGKPCATNQTPNGTWQLDETDPRDPRHCCL